MAYVVSARKYRPQRFEEVVGQSHVTSTITNALLNDKLAHAFLFCGPRGVGKTTCARLLAKVINMPEPKTALQDGSYAESDIDISLNIVELDAASNNSVENMRTLIEQVRFQPQQGKYKVFIIDEVHMLSVAAFNAFLKTLEEPPPYAIFILATTERHKILPTILSRCQLYDFRRIQIPDIIEQLQKIAKEENIEAEYDALYVIAEKADGAMRDALSIFDRVASASNSKITLQSVVENLNILDFDYFFRAVENILQEDASGLIVLLNQVLKNGFEGDLFMNGLAQHLRNLLYCKQEPTQQLLQMSSELKERYLNQSQTISYSTIMTALNLANACDLDYLKAKDKRLHVEIALLKICFAARQVLPGQAPIATNTQKKTPELSNVATNHSAPSQTPPQSIAPQPTAQPTAQSSPQPTAQPRQPVQQSAPPTQPVQTVQDPVQNTPTDADPSTTTTTTPTPAPVSKTAAPVSNIKNTPQLSSIADMLKSAQKEIASEDNTPKALVMEEVDEIWEGYASSLESTTTAAIVRNVIKDIVDNQLVLVSPSNIAREEIQQETELYSKLREHFNQRDLTIKIDVDRSQFPDFEEQQVKKALTPKEKYDHLKSVNPLIDDLIDTLGLKPGL